MSARILPLLFVILMFVLRIHHTRGTMSGGLAPVPAGLAIVRVVIGDEHREG